MQNENAHKPTSSRRYVYHELQPDLPLIEILDDKRLLIENHRGIICYGSDQIIVKVKKGSILVYGEQLRLSNMNKGKLVIMGKICGVQMMKGCSADGA